MAERASRWENDPSTRRTNALSVPFCDCRGHASIGFCICHAPNCPDEDDFYWDEDSAEPPERIAARAERIRRERSEVFVPRELLDRLIEAGERMRDCVPAQVRQERPEGRA